RGRNTRRGIDDSEGRRDTGVEHAQTSGLHALQQLLGFSLGHDELDLHGKRTGQLEECALVQQVVAAESGHGTERRTATHAERVGLLEQPFPYRPPLIALAFVHIESQERALHWLHSRWPALMP